MLGSCRGGSSREGEILYDSEGASLSRDISRGSIVLFMLCDVRKHGEVTDACRSCSRKASQDAAVANDEVIYVSGCLGFRCGDGGEVDRRLNRRQG